HRPLLTTSHRSKNHPELQKHAQIANEPAITGGTGRTHLALALFEYSRASLGRGPHRFERDRAATFT
ncbi:hypothetical protein, partial [Streptomyces sp. NPDC051452]|uniref:hypothetical protein n=1 Tax=Streptomyces sp. NPDC051452 TaxID=3365654 RepID=UPI0037979B2C